MSLPEATFADIRRHVRSRDRSDSPTPYGVEATYSCHICQRSDGFCWLIDADGREVWACWTCLTDWAEQNGANE